MNRKTALFLFLLAIPILCVGLTVPPQGLLTLGDAIAVTDSTNDGTSNLTAALAAAGTKEKTLYINATCSFVTNATLPENLNLVFGPQGRFVTGTSTVTIKSTITAGRYKIFDDASGGQILIAGTWTPVIYPHWWKAKPQTTGWTSEIQKAINSIKLFPAYYNGVIDARGTNFDFSAYTNDGGLPGFTLLGDAGGNKFHHYFGAWDTDYIIYGGKGRTNGGNDPQITLWNNSYEGYRNPAIAVRRGADANSVLMWILGFADDKNALASVDNADINLAAGQRDSYSSGTITVINGSTTVSVSSASLNTNMISGILVDTTNNFSGIIQNVTGNTVITLYSGWAGPSATNTTFFIQGGKGSLTRPNLRFGQNGTLIVNGDKGDGAADCNECRLVADLGLSYRLFGGMQKDGSNQTGNRFRLESYSTLNGNTGIEFLDKAYAGTPSATVYLRKVPSNGSYIEIGNTPGGQSWMTISSQAVGIKNFMQLTAIATPSTPANGMIFLSSSDNNIYAYSSGTWRAW